MINFETVSYEALDYYFKALAKTGNVNDGTTNQLILFVALSEFLEDYQDFITEEDFDVVCRIMSCIQDNSCIVPYSKDSVFTAAIENYRKTIPIRITNRGSNARSTESVDIRLSE